MHMEMCICMCCIDVARGVRDRRYGVVCALELTGGSLHERVYRLFTLLQVPQHQTHVTLTQHIRLHHIQNVTMSGLPRPGPPVKRNTTSMRPPTTRPPHLARGRSATPAMDGRSSRAESVASARIPRSSPLKRKADFESDGGEETNINVVVRCRGRNDREVRENSGVVVSTNGIRGTAVDLSMGPSALSNKTYQFDKVFSPAADQAMMYDEVVAPILDEVS
jgi:hypothetical protein